MLAAGSLDTTFNPFGAIPGVVLQNFDFQDDAHAVAVQTDGKILVAGTFGDGSAPDRDFAVARFNVDGSLDTTFGVGGPDGINGLATVDFLGQQDELRDVLIDSSGNIVLVGVAQNASGFDGVGIARLDVNGILDPTFDGDGKLTDIVTNWTIEMRGASIDASGNIVTAGRIQHIFGGPGDQDFIVARYLSTGGRDFSFATIGGFAGGGMKVTDFGGRDEGFDVKIQPSDGRIVVGGRGGLLPTDAHFALARFNTDGSLDTAFDGDGLATTDIPAFTTDFIDSLAIQTDGKIVAAGSSISGVTGDIVVARYNTDGSLDTTGFNGGLGYNQLSPGNFDFGEGVALQPNGAIVVSGTAGSGSGEQTVVLRLTTAGVLDAGFGSGGMTITNVSATPGEAERLRDVVITADDKIVAAGVVAGSLGTDFLVMRLDTGAIEVDSGGPYTIPEPGGTITLNGATTASSPTYDWDLDNDGIFGETGVAALYGDEVGQNPTFTVTGVDDPTVFPITLRVTSGSDQAFDSTTVTVTNVAPTLTISGAASVNEGSTYTLNLSTSDPGADTITSWTINWGDSVQVVSGNPSSVTHTYGDGPNGYTISATATDEDGTYAAGNTVAVTVDNVAPVITGVSNSSPTIGGAHENQNVTISATFTDAGVLDTHTGTIDWGDGSTSVGTVVESGGSGSISATHAYVNGGIYTVTITVTDDDTGQDTETTFTVIAGVGRDAVTGVLEIVGTNGADDIKVIKQSSSTIKVKYDLAGEPLLERTFNTSGPTAISAIEMYLGGGDDYAALASDVAKNATIFGDDGNDKLIGGSGSDVLIGGDGLDLLYGRAGRDLLIGGQCIDALFGDADGDIIVGGDTDLDVDLGTLAGVAQRNAQLADLNAIMAVWNGAGTYSQRVTAVLPLANLHFFDDNDADLLAGGAGQDLFFSGDQGWLDDIALDQALNELEFELLE